MPIVLFDLSDEVILIAIDKTKEEITICRNTTLGISKVVSETVVNNITKSPKALRLCTKREKRNLNILIKLGYQKHPQARSWSVWVFDAQVCCYLFQNGGGFWQVWCHKALDQRAAWIITCENSQLPDAVAIIMQNFHASPTMAVNITAVFQMIDSVTIIGTPGCSFKKLALNGTWSGNFTRRTFISVIAKKNFSRAISGKPADIKVWTKLD